MKKYLSIVFLLALIILCFSSCSGQRTNGDNDKIAFEAGVYQNKNWDDTVLTYSGSAIPDKETAVEAAKAIINGMELGESLKNIKPQHVFFDEQDEIWIVDFWKEPDKNSTIRSVGDSVCIAMQKSDGKVLRIWLGE